MQNIGATTPKTQRALALVRMTYEVKVAERRLTQCRSRLLPRCYYEDEHQDADYEAPSYQASLDQKAYQVALSVLKKTTKSFLRLKASTKKKD